MSSTLEVVDEIFERHQLKPKAAIVGHSLGTIVAGWIIKERPNIVDKTVLIDPDWTWCFGILLRKKHALLGIWDVGSGAENDRIIHAPRVHQYLKRNDVPSVLLKGYGHADALLIPTLEQDMMLQAILIDIKLD
ncbi:hypothetical protein Unana1_01369 [Umbelopsis nana]